MSTQNNGVDQIVLGNVTLSEDMNWSIDASLTTEGTSLTGESDNLKSNSNPALNNNNIVIDSIILMAGSTKRSVKTLVADNNIKLAIALASGNIITLADGVSGSAY